MTDPKLIPTSVAFTPEDKQLLTRLHQRTGLPRSTLLRRLIQAYASGTEVPGLPKLDPPLTTRAP